MSWSLTIVQQLPLTLALLSITAAISYLKIIKIGFEYFFIREQSPQEILDKPPSGGFPELCASGSR